MGFYYDQQGFYYDKHQADGFYYDQNGFYYNEDGFYYNEKDGFYYDQQQRGFYYEGFYYDQQDKLNKDNKDYWAKGNGRDRVVKALDGLRTLVDERVANDKSGPNETQGKALNNVITTQVVREVIKKFNKNVNPKEYFANGGDDKKLGTLLAKECQNILGPDVDFRSKWRAEGSDAKKAMDQVTNQLVPFMVNWHSKEPWHKPNAIENAAMMKLVAARLVDEVFYEYATKTDPKTLNKDDVHGEVAFIAKFLSETALSILSKDKQETKKA